MAFGAIIAGIGGLLLASKKVRKEIKRFGKKVKKKLKKVVKSKAFKIIAAAVLLVTGAHFVAGMMGAGGGTAATLATTEAAANASVFARTATALANGAKTAYNTLATVGYSAGQSTTAFLSKGMDALTGKTVENTGFESGSFVSTPADAAKDMAKAIQADPTGVDPSFYNLDATKATSKATSKVADSITLDEITGMKATKVTDPTSAPLSGFRTPEEIAAQTFPKKELTQLETPAIEKPSLLSASTAKEITDAYTKASEGPKKSEGIVPQFDSFDPSFEGSNLFTPEQIVNFAARFPLIDPNTFISGPIDSSAFFSTTKQLTERRYA